MEDHGIAENDLLRFADLVEERLGLEFDPGEHDRLAILMRECMRETAWARFTSYEQRVCDRSGDELRTLAAKLTVPETYFFRHPEKVAALTESVQPELNRTQPGRLIRGLSAGCSTGEEPFTFAMTVRETAGFDPLLVSITIVDINSECIESSHWTR